MHGGATERERSLFAESLGCDAGRTLNFADMQDLVFRSALESGNVFVLTPHKLHKINKEGVDHCPGLRDGRRFIWIQINICCYFSIALAILTSMRSSSSSALVMRAVRVSLSFLGLCSS